METLLWWELRRKRLGVRFRRQEPIGPFIVDFVCLPKKLVVEVDGESHDDHLAEDLNRDQWLHRHGYFVLHLDNDHILEDINGAVARIEQALEDPDSVLDPQGLGDY